MAYFKQHLSMAIHKTAAAELKRNIRYGTPPAGSTRTSTRKGRKTAPARATRLVENLAAYGRHRGSRRLRRHWRLQHAEP